MNFEKLIEEAKAVTKDVQDTFGAWTSEQINFKPSAESWSAAQCLEHLIAADRHYVEKIQSVADGTHKNNVFSMIPLLPSFFGGFIVKAVHPDNVKKVKTFSSFEPSKSDIDPKIVSDFVSRQERFIALMEKLKNEDRDSIKIETPISKALTIKLSDAFELLVLHSRRHFNQGKRIAEMDGFPE